MRASAATSVPSFARKLPRTESPWSRSMHATRTPRRDRSASMRGSASAFTAPVASKSSRMTQLSAQPPSAPKRMRSTANASSSTEGSERLWNISRATPAASAPAATMADAAARAAASVFWYWKRPVSVTSPV